MPDSHELHRSSFVADLHCDTVLWIRRGRDFSRRNDEGHIDLPRLIDGGVNLQVFACWIDSKLPADRCRAEAEELIALLKRTLSPLTDRIVVCRSRSEIEAAHQSGKISAILAIENGTAIEEKLENLAHFHDLGVRLLTLTHFKSSAWCESSSDTASNLSGLSEFGREVVTEMNRLGMIIDISHASVKAVEDVLTTSSSPIVASHSCAYQLCQTDRNLTDSQIRAIADSGGMIGLNFSTGFISQAWEDTASGYYSRHKDDIESIDSLIDAAFLPANKVKPVYRDFWRTVDQIPVTLKQAVDHIDHMYRIAGADHIGLGSDFDGIPRSPIGLEDCSKLPALTAELDRRGYRPEDISKILGANFLRVFREICG